jgi:ActR/RegA family two-component response regulator
MSALPLNPALRVVVIDDDSTFVDTLVEQFELKGVYALGLKTPTDLLQSTKQAPYADFDMIFLDMRLSDPAKGPLITAADVLLHLMTYNSTAKVVVFTHEDISPAECARCIQLGALGIIPKSPDIDHYVLIGQAYRHLGDEKKAREERIRSLWAKLDDASDLMKGKYLEMLLVNIFDSISGLRVVNYNKDFNAGEIDIIVENRATHEFWNTLESLYLAVECKNQSKPSGTKEYNILECLSGNILNPLNRL